MSEDFIFAGVALAAALVFIVYQHVLIRKLIGTIGDIATGKVELTVEGNDIFIKKLGEK
jgi:hypothetical protein